MIVVYDYRCTNDHMYEAFVEKGTDSHRCDCGANSKRVISPVGCVLDPISGHFPGATDKWAKHHSEEARKTTDNW